MLHLLGWLKSRAITMWLSTYRNSNIQQTSSDYSKLFLIACTLNFSLYHYSLCIHYLFCVCLSTVYNYTIPILNLHSLYHFCSSSMMYYQGCIQPPAYCALGIIQYAVTIFLACTTDHMHDCAIYTQFDSLHYHSLVYIILIMVQFIVYTTIHYAVYIIQQCVSSCQLHGTNIIVYI